MNRPRRIACGFALICFAIFALPSYTIASELDDLIHIAKEEDPGTNYNLIISTWDAVLKLQPTNTLAYERRGHAHWYNGDHAKAMDDLNEAVRLNPKDAYAYVCRAFAHDNIDKRIADYSMAIQLSPKYASAYACRALLYFEKKDVDKARADLNKAIAADPKNHDYYEARGRFYSDMGWFESALSDYTKSIQLNPTRLWGYIGRASVYEKSAFASAKRGDAAHEKIDLDHVLADFDRFIRLDPTNNWIRFPRGTFYERTGQFEKAIATFQEGLRTDPNDAFSYCELAWIYATCPKDSIRDGQKAMELAKKYCALPGANDLERNGVLAVAYAEIGDFENAIKHQKMFIEKGDRLKDEFRVKARERLEHFQQHKPYYEPPTILTTVK